MKLLRYGPPGGERPGLLDAEGRVRDLSGEIDDFAGPSVSRARLEGLRTLDVASLPVVEAPGRIGPCLAWVPNFYCIGLNYARHAREANMPEPSEPIIFSKATSALAGPEDALRLPPGAEKGDWELELGVVIGARAWQVSEAEALGVVAGYCTVNDLSERSFQLEHGGQWIKGKSAPGFGPIGPWLVTPDEVPDPQALDLRLTLNSEVMQASSTADMIFSVAQIISYMSRFLELVPGDIIATGTPEGVGMGQMPPRFLRPGDVLEGEVAGLGRQRQEVLG